MTVADISLTYPSSMSFSIVFSNLFSSSDRMRQAGEQNAKPAESLRPSASSMSPHSTRLCHMSVTVKQAFGSLEANIMSFMVAVVTLKDMTPA